MYCFAGHCPCSYSATQMWLWKSYLPSLELSWFICQMRWLGGNWGHIQIWESRILAYNSVDFQLFKQDCFMKFQNQSIRMAPEGDLAHYLKYLNYEIHYACRKCIKYVCIVKRRKIKFTPRHLLPSLRNRALPAPWEPIGLSLKHPFPTLSQIVCLLFPCFSL